MGFFKPSVKPVSAIEPSDNRKYAMNSPFFMKRKILCQVWGNDGTIHRLLATKKVSYGQVDFKVKTGKTTSRLFQINYDPAVGAIKQGKKYFIYDIHFDDSIGCLGFHQYKEAKSVDSKQADTMLQDGAVDFFIAKGGIPMIYLMIAMIGIIVSAGALAIITPDYIHTTQIAQLQDKQLSADANTISQLQQQVNAMKGQGILVH